MTVSTRPEIKTMANLESAFAGETMAHIKYRYFAKLARETGDEATARTFEETADQEVMHAFGHLDLLYPKATHDPRQSAANRHRRRNLRIHRDVPRLSQNRRTRRQRGAVAEMDEQIAESKVHAASFKATLEKAQKRFAALAKVEERHANHYKAQLASWLPDRLRTRPANNCYYLIAIYTYFTGLKPI